MAVTPEELKEALEHSGLPQPLVESAEQPIDDGKIKTEYLLGSKLLQAQKAIIVYGNDSPMKERVCAKLMRRYMFQNEKTGRWLTPLNIPNTLQDLPTAGIVTIVGLDLLSPIQAKIVAQAVRDWVSRGRAVVLSVSTEQALTTVFGGDLQNYLSHCAAVITVDIPPAKQFT